MRRRMAWSTLAILALVLVSGCRASGKESREGRSNMQVHYLEIVCNDVAAECAVLEKIHSPVRPPS